MFQLRFSRSFAYSARRPECPMRLFDVRQNQWSRCRLPREVPSSPKSWGPSTSLSPIFSRARSYDSSPCSHTSRGQVRYYVHAFRFSNHFEAVCRISEMRIFPLNRARVPYCSARIHCVFNRRWTFMKRQVQLLIEYVHIPLRIKNDKTSDIIPYCCVVKSNLCGRMVNLSLNLNLVPRLLKGFTCSP